MNMFLHEHALPVFKSKTRRLVVPMQAAGLVVLALFAARFPAQAQDASDEYLSIFNVIKRADQLSTNGPPSAALAKYRDAQGYLLQFQSLYPRWHPDIVSLRMHYLATRVADMSVTNAAQHTRWPF